MLFIVTDGKERRLQLNDMQGPEEVGISLIPRYSIHRFSTTGGKEAVREQMRRDFRYIKGGPLNRSQKIADGTLRQDGKIVLFQ